MGGVFVKTFGCQMNEYDTEKVVSLLADSYQPAESLDDASVVFVNTCSVREKGEHKLFSLLGRLRDLKRERPELVIGVGGCVAQQEGEQIIKKNRAVDFVVGTHNLSLVPALVQGARDGRKAQIAIDYRDEWEELPDAFVPLNGLSDEQTANLPMSSVRALVSIQRGCNKRCSFCVVPTTRGSEVSRAAEEIEREIRLKVRLGAKEVMLLGQTVNSYGRDLEPRFPFEKLIERIALIPGVERIRFTSPHPQEVRPAFVDLYGRIPQLCPHIHLPLQSGNDRILKLMNRNYRTKRYLQIVEMLRERVPDIAITTDLIVGFPTESEADFEDTLEMMRRVRYNSSYSFKYSKRPNTTAIESFDDTEEIDDQVARRRLHELQALQEELSSEINRQFQGRIVDVLVEERSTNISSCMRGRIPENTLVEVSDSSCKTGDVARVTIEHTSPHGLRGSLCDKAVGTNV